MRKVLTAAQMRDVDRLTTERYGIPSIILMENAAHAVARVITEKLGGSVKGKSILILCGKGNNGDAGAALARILGVAGAGAEVHLLGDQGETRGDAADNFAIADRLTNGKYASRPETDREMGQVFESFLFPSRGEVRFEEAEDEEAWYDILGPGQLLEYECVVDAVFGFGFKGSVDPFLTTVFENIRNTIDLRNSIVETPRRPLFVSIDIPSGLTAEMTQPIVDSMVADVTVTFTAPKPANVLPPGAKLNGELIVADIGSPQHLIDEQPSQLFVAEESNVHAWLTRTHFRDNSYKNKRGHALVIAGSETYSGAAVLSGNSAIRSGVGLVTLACPSKAKTEIASRILPEIILATLGSPEFDELSSKANAIAVGPGLSATNPEIESLVRKIVEERTTPVIVDAGALSYFNPPNGIPWRHADEGVRVPLILTPHEGEFMRLLGTDDKEVIKDRVAAVREFSQKNNVIPVLKGERVLIGHPDGRVVVNPTGSSGLGKAGNGDTLTGILVGFCAQAAAMDIDIFETVVAAVYIAGLAGDIAEKKYGKRVMTASDVRECLTQAFKSIEDTVS